jgi:hypothetical protein
MMPCSRNKPGPLREECGYQRRRWEQNHQTRVVRKIRVQFSLGCIFLRTFFVLNFSSSGIDDIRLWRVAATHAVVRDASAEMKKGAADAMASLISIACSLTIKISVLLCIISQVMSLREDGDELAYPVRSLCARATVVCCPALKPYSKLVPLLEFQSWMDAFKDVVLENPTLISTVRTYFLSLSVLDGHVPEMAKSRLGTKGNILKPESTSQTTI